MYKFLKLLCLVAISILCLTLLEACGEASSTQNNPAVLITPYPTPPPEINWLKGIPCKAPCWANIIPGKTTAIQAKALLKATGLAATIEDKDKGAIHTISWQWQERINILNEGVGAVV